jgi:hypothetical protein
LTNNPISYDHPNRLDAILTTYFPFLPDAGFSVTESSYDATRLSGRTLLRRPDVVIEARLRNDDLDLAIAPAVATPIYVKLNLLVRYLDSARVDYPEFMRRRSEPEPSQEAIWRAEAADVAAHLDRILAFAQAEGFDERNAERERYEAEVAADIDRQIAEYQNYQD